jgi:hypothetical protein
VPDGHARKDVHAAHGAASHAPLDLDGVGPIVALPSESAACASRPDQELDDRYQTYESNPAPWWIALLWAAFLSFGAAYLIVNLIE